MTKEISDIRVIGGAISVAAVFVAFIVNLLRPKRSTYYPQVTQYTQPTIEYPTEDKASDEQKVFWLGIHGIYHDNEDGSSRQKIIRSCHVGEKLMFVREPDNKYDKLAVKVCKENGEQLGYLGTEQASEMSDNILSGWTYRVTVDKMYLEKDRSNCRIRIAVLTQSDYTEKWKKASAERAAAKAAKP